MEQFLSVVRDSDAMGEKEIGNFYAYAFSLYQAGDWTRAAEIFQVLCERCPFEPKFWFGLGASLQQEGKDFEKALRAWAMTAFLEPENPYPHFHAAECASSLKRPEEAAAALQEADAKAEESHPLKGRIDALKRSWNLCP
ncbi:MAG: tetratricopeptide repeat protein [Verrucomicrobiota bacterium]|nr:tetratricopeptide repeat protein [Verrucomicrobiota bacterium]